jgi:4'-phosphopantetheinyl transferase
MPADPAFVAARPSIAARQLDDRSIHLWRIPYATPQGRAPLLELLASYLDQPASFIVLEQDARGKPRLADTASTGGVCNRLEFNWSHSGGFALVALARGCAVGVDIERLGKPRRPVDIARRFFDPDEAAALEPLDPAARDAAFIRLWCAKEAVLKAAGEGLSFGLARLAFARNAEADWKLTRIDPALGRIDDWQLAGFQAAPGYPGALAWRGEYRAVTAFRPIGSDG